MTKAKLLSELKLQSFKSHRGHDGDGFNATLIYKGVKIAHVHDDAWGGGYNYTFLERDDKKRAIQRELFKALTGEIKKLTKEYNKELDFEYSVSLDGLVDALVNQIQLRKDEKKGICVKVQGGWQVIGFKTSIPTTIKNWKDGRSALQKLVFEELKKGSEILNTEYLESVGIKTTK